MNVRPLEPADIPWAANLMESRRQLYALYSPVFWWPAHDGTDLHARYLVRQIETETTSDYEQTTASSSDSTA
ncbi:MAG: hypothetical protein ACRDRO_00125 [Pseudonocardiaceae bacterium]